MQPRLLDANDQYYSPKHALEVVTLIGVQGGSMALH